MEKENLNYLKFPVLKKIEQGYFGKIEYYKADDVEGGLYRDSRFKSFLPDCFKLLLQHGAGENIQMISKSFDEAISTSFEKLLGDKDKFWGKMTAQSGTLLFNNGFVIMYHINPDPENVDESDHTILVLREGEMPVFIGMSMIGDNDRIIYLSKLYEEEMGKILMSNMSDEFPDLQSIQSPDQHLSLLTRIYQINYYRLVTTLAFIKYADIETKYLPAGQKTKAIDCIYKNTTRSNITYLNSTWFTNLVKSDAFKVRGHFRLQPHGPGLKEHKLIWINEFEKTGYTAPARKLNEYPDSL